MSMMMLRLMQCSWLTCKLTLRVLHPDLLVEMDNFDLVDGDNVHDPTTTIQGCCALATDTPTPRIVVFLWCATRPRGHSSCKQSKNKQEHFEQSQLQYIYRTFDLKSQDGGVPFTIRRAVYPTRALKCGSKWLI